MCWCKHNNNGNNTKKKLNNTLNIINLNIRTQHYLDWGTALALFKEIQALGWLIFVTGADLLWLVSPRIQQPNKCCVARTASAQSVQTQSSTKRTPFFGPKSLKYLEILLNSLSHTILFAFNYLSIHSWYEISPSQSRIYSLPLLHITYMLFINFENSS